MFAWPKTTAPAPRSAATTAASACGAAGSSTLQPACERMPATSTLGVTRKGTPASAPRSGAGAGAGAPPAAAAGTGAARPRRSRSASGEKLGSSIASNLTSSKRESSAPT